MNYSYLDFLEGASATGKTKIVTVLSKNHGDTLGQIRWFGRWRQYAFFPANDTVFNPGCMQDICDEIERLMGERRKPKYDDYVDVHNE